VGLRSGDKGQTKGRSARVEPWEYWEVEMELLRKQNYEVR
jgi:hypothetical protein